MSITSYGELKTAVANWLDRADLEDRIPEFISIVQGKLYYGFGEDAGRVEPLRIDAMLTSADLSPSSGVAAKPSGFLEARRVYVNGAVKATPSFLAPEDFWNRQAVGESGYPDFFTIEGSNFIFAPNGDAYTMKLLYYAKFTALSSDDDADWIITNHPFMYLSGALAEAYGYIEEPLLAAHWQEQFINAVKGVQISADRETRSGSVLIQRPGAVA
jgi:hypothetical protein